MDEIGAVKAARAGLAAIRNGIEAYDATAGRIETCRPAMKRMSQEEIGSAVDSILKQPDHAMKVAGIISRHGRNPAPMRHFEDWLSALKARREAEKGRDATIEALRTARLSVASRDEAATRMGKHGLASFEPGRIAAHLSLDGLPALLARFTPLAGKVRAALRQGYEGGRPALLQDARLLCAPPPPLERIETEAESASQRLSSTSADPADAFRRSLVEGIGGAKENTPFGVLLEEALRGHGIAPDRLFCTQRLDDLAFLVSNDLEGLRSLEKELTRMLAAPSITPAMARTISRIPAVADPFVEAVPVTEQDLMAPALDETLRTFLRRHKEVRVAARGPTHEATPSHGTSP